MNAIRTGYFNPSLPKKDARTSLTVLGVMLVLTGGVLLLQTIKYASSIQVLLEVGYRNWWEYLGMMLRSLVTWAVVIGVVFAIQFVSQPAVREGRRLFL